MVISVDGFTAARSQAIEDNAIVTGSVNGDGDLILGKFGGGTVNAGHVVGDVGPAGSIIICTSSTRPTAAEGVAIWETDTNKFLIYNGIAWTPPWNMPWGPVATPKNITTPQGSISTEEDVTGSSFTFNYVNNRIYRHTIDAIIAHDNADAAIILRIVNGSGTELRRFAAHPHLIGSNDSAHFTWNERGQIAGSFTRKLTCEAAPGSNCSLQNDNAPLQYLIEDIGPDGAPA